ncbi:MAG: ABC transporter substrate-binding protein [Actinomycetota bacterium]|nr:ABC transporter substrate-binding protein [Actinomycetota bacterium]
MATLVAVAVAIGVVACGDDGSKSSSPGGGSQVTTLKIGLIPITPVAPVYLGIKKGFFAAEKLKVEPQLAQGGAAIVPAVQSGDEQIGFSNSVSLMIAQTRGLGVKIVAPGEVSPTDPKDDNSALMVPKDSDISSAKDMEGKKIGVNTLKNIAGLTIEASLAKEGVDPKSLKLVEVPFPEMQKVVERGDIDVGFFNEPFTSQAEAAGARSIVKPYTATAPNLPIAPYFAMADWIEKNKDVLARFQRAMKKSTQYAIDHPDELRQILTEYTQIPPEAAKKIRLPNLGTELDPARFEVLAGLVQKFGYTEEKPDVSKLVVAPG